MRKKIVAGNWKMHGSRASITALIESIKQGISAKKTNNFNHIDIVVFPSFVFLQQAEKLLVDTQIAWGAQNLYLGEQGAFTGEISATMLVDFGCQYVLIGHSERRAIFNEDLQLIAAKFKTAIQWGLRPLLCVGETLEQRENQLTQKIITEQIESIIEMIGIDPFRYAVIAYEPVWAIGTGKTATPEQAQEVHLFIRQLLTKHDAGIASSMRILYGGSVKADNAAGLFAMPDIDGGLVGGASLDANTFLTICEAAVSRNCVLEGKR